VVSFGSWGYGKTPVIVLSSNPIAIPESIPDTVTHSAESPAALLQRLSGEGVNHVYVDGGNTIRRFLAKGLINEITVTVIPILLGDGISLFGPLEESVELTHLRTHSYEFGFVQTTYSTRSGDAEPVFVAD
jgi:dihydrofolate reductase